MNVVPIWLIVTLHELLKERSVILEQPNLSNRPTGNQNIVDSQLMSLPAGMSLPIGVNMKELLKRAALRDDYRQLIMNCINILLDEMKRDPELEKIVTSMAQRVERKPITIDDAATAPFGALLSFAGAGTASTSSQVALGRLIRDILYYQNQIKQWMRHTYYYSSKRISVSYLKSVKVVQRKLGECRQVGLEIPTYRDSMH